MEPDPRDVLEFWLADAAADPARAASREGSWFGASEELDATIRERFGNAIEVAERGGLDDWLSDPASSLALVLLLDQFPRNVWRGTARAFSCDPQARQVADQSLTRGHFERLAPIERAFLVLPFQHAESIEWQHESVGWSIRIVRESPPEWHPLLERYLDFARQHLALIERFGRFPHRNRVLGRASTPEEEAYLGSGDARFGQ